MNRRVLITGATGDTGRAATKESIGRGLTVRAMVHRKDDRSAALEKQGAEVVEGDLLAIDTIRAAMEGVDAAYLVYPVAPRAHQRNRQLRPGRQGSRRHRRHQPVAEIGRPPFPERFLQGDPLLPSRS